MTIKKHNNILLGFLLLEPTEGVAENIIKYNDNVNIMSGGVFCLWSRREAQRCRHNSIES